jgi:transcriptional regulator GlxA family with amidase domain
VEAPLISSEQTGPFDELMAYAVAHLDEDVTVEDLAARAFMSRRSFDRRFRDVAGTSPLQWLLHQRVLRAQQLLETTDLGIDVVARKVGFTSGIALRPHFRRIVGIAPQAYRRAFRPDP